MKDMFENNQGLFKKDKRLGILLWYYLSRFFNRSNRKSNQFLKAFNLSAAQFDVLVQIGSHTRLTQKELGDKLLVTKGNITQLLIKMEKAGWILREVDWKTKYLSLTEKGEALYSDVVPKQEEFQASQFTNLNREEQLQLLSLLKKLHKTDKKGE